MKFFSTWEHYFSLRRRVRREKLDKYFELRPGLKGFD
jgi:hypothetical protein